MRFDIIDFEFVADVVWGDDVMLLAMDAAGLSTVITVLDSCARTGSARLIDNARMYTFLVEPGAADIDITGRQSVWRLDRDKVVELVARLRSLQHLDCAGVGGVDISGPTDTLLLWRRSGAFDTSHTPDTIESNSRSFVLADSGW